ncbi:hypothetical protein NC653_007334 [Populus alba x Populus x berolinensis]|nr:hypothetical protein NC653_007334 [Populus alba x Populus x berolinensis]
MPGFQINMHTRATVFQKQDHVSGKTTWCQGRLPLAQPRGQYYNSSHFTSWKHSQGQSCCWLPHERGVIWRRRKRKNSSMKRRWSDGG